MLSRTLTAGLMLLALPARPVSADVVTMKNGRVLEGLVIDVDERRLVLCRAAEGVTQSWRLDRSEITSLRLAPPDVSGFRSVARRLEADRAEDEAGEALRKVCLLRPEDAADQIRLVQFYRRIGHIDDALAAAQTAWRAHPNDARIPLEQGEIALAQGRGPDAVTLARENLRIAGASSEAGVWLLARSLEQGGQADEALAAYRDLLRAHPSRIDALERFTDLSLVQGKPEQAVDEAQRVTRLTPELRGGWIFLGKVHYRQNRFAQAVAAFQSATRLGGEDYDRARIFLQCALARRYERHPRAVLTTADLEVAAQLDPELRRNPQ
jgi:cytochrome c-type biogenesis protein CcmH/NrfG